MPWLTEFYNFQETKPSAYLSVQTCIALFLTALLCLEPVNVLFHLNFALPFPRILH